MLIFLEDRVHLLVQVIATITIIQVLVMPGTLDDVGNSLRYVRGRDYSSAASAKFGNNINAGRSSGGVSIKGDSSNLALHDISTGLLSALECKCW
jgi:hypothetical protein